MERQRDDARQLAEMTNHPATHTETVCPLMRIATSGQMQPVQVSGSTSPNRISVPNYFSRPIWCTQHPTNT